MRKFLDEVDRKNLDTVVQDSKVDFQKRGLLRSVGDFPISVLHAIEVWLFSFPTGMTRDAFQRQMKNIDKDEQTALAQLNAAHGFRVIKKAKTERQKYWDKISAFPPMSKSFLENIAEDRLFYSIAGGRSVCEKYVKQAIKDLRQYGTVYVLPTDEVFSMLKRLNDRGGSDELLDRAKKCDFLIMENLDQEVGIISKAAVWSITSLINLRVQQKKPTLCRFKDCYLLDTLYERCPVYFVGGSANDR